MENLDWLQRHLEKCIEHSTPKERLQSFLHRPSASPLRATGEDKVGVELVTEAAEVVRGIEERAEQTERYAKGVVKNALEKLQFAEVRIQELVKELGAERRAADAYVDKANVMIRDSAEALKVERARLKAAEDQLRRLETRATAAEARAEESENTVVLIEEAIRTQLLGQRQSVSKIAPAA